MYRGVATEDPQACAGRCATLLRQALGGFRTAERAQAALEGLLGTLPTNPGKLDPTALRTIASLVPLAVACLRGGEAEPVAWHRLLGLLLAEAAATAAVPAPTGRSPSDTVEAMVGVVALAASPAAARRALHSALCNFGSPGAAPPAPRLAVQLLPVLRVGFGGSSLDGVQLYRRDLTALLHAVRVTGLCQRAEANEEEVLAIEEARDLLRSALERGFDAPAMLPELRQSLSYVPALRQKVLKPRLAEGSKASKAASGRAGAASLVVEVLQAAAAAAPTSFVTRLAGLCGLPVEADEELDQRAVAARALGDLFFEDVEGAGFQAPEILEEPVAKPAPRRASKAKEKPEASRKRVLQDITGLNELGEPELEERAEKRLRDAKAQTQGTLKLPGMPTFSRRNPLGDELEPQRRPRGRGRRAGKRSQDD